MDGKSFCTPNKKHFWNKEKTDIDDLDKCVIRSTISQFIECIQFRGSKGSLWRVERSVVSDGEKMITRTFSKEREDRHR
jgi:hypothetical protein